MNHECGLLVDGYDQPPIVLTPWHPPYYRELLESTGLSKQMDLLMWSLVLNEFYAGDSFDPTIHKLAEKCETKHGVTIRNMRA